jgi:uncharacterized protein
MISHADDMPVWALRSNQQQELIANYLISREGLLNKIYGDSRRDIDDECGYPKTITVEQYRNMYDRELGKRVVNVYPEETWAREPFIYETNDPTIPETAFESDWAELNKNLAGPGWGSSNDDQGHMMCHYMQRIDELSGIGHYGILFLGLDDGKDFSEPVAGINPKTGEQLDDGPEHRLMYVRTFDESLLSVRSYERDPTSPRFGQPTAYNVKFVDVKTEESGATAFQDSKDAKIHWTRCIHIADNRTNSEVFGVPRQRPVWNRLYDLRKVLGGTGEMHWKGGFPGISLETQKGLEDAELDMAATRQMLWDYQNGLQRYLALVGMTAKSLDPQIADPSEPFDVEIKAICVIIGVPYRVFLGTEEAKLAGKQDDDRWGRRLMRRQQRYVSPQIIRPTIDRLINIRVLSAPNENRGYTIDWPSMIEVSDMDRAAVAKVRTEAYGEYTKSGVDTLIAPFEYLTKIHGMQEDMAQQILEAAVDHINDATPNDDDVIVPGRNPRPSVDPNATQVGGIRIRRRGGDANSTAGAP